MTAAQLAWLLLSVSAGLAVALVLLLRRRPYLVIAAENQRQRRRARLACRHVEVAGHRWTYVLREGAMADAPTVVMVHGFTGSKENWYALAARLDPRYRLLIVDLPGWGESERIDGQDYGFNAQAKRLAEFIRVVARRPAGELVLLGHSMGGGIVALVAARHPELVERVGMFNAAGVRFADNVFGQGVLDGGNPFAVSDAASLRTYIDTVFLIPASKPHIPGWAVPVVAAWRRSEAPFEQQVLDRIGRGDESFLPYEEAGDIIQPSLLVYSAQDAVIDPSALTIYGERIPQARRVLLQGSGHMSIIEQPGEVAAAIDQLIELGVAR